MAKGNQLKRVFEDDELLSRNNDQFLFTEVDGESVVMNIENGKYFGMNSVATDVWFLLEKNMTYNEIIKSLLSSYEVDEKTCRDDTRPIIARMILSTLLVKK